jgi:RimJ/RimL family protein N-acetyltransferase
MAGDASGGRRPTGPFLVPELAGDGWVLRPWRPEDAPVLAEAWSDPDIAAHCAVPDDAGPARARAWIAGWEGRRASGASLDLVVVVDDGGVVGEVGLAPLRGVVRDVVELGWWVLPAWRGRGLAAAAVPALAAWAATALEGRAVVARIPPGHTASERIAAAAGLVRAGRLDRTHDLWRLPTPELAR